MRCNDCGFVFVDTAPGDEELKKIYGSSYFSSNKYFDLLTLNKEYRRRLDLIRTYLPEKESKILDYGCAKGDFVEYVGNKFEMHGVDYSDDAISEAIRSSNKMKSKLFYFKDFFDPNFNQLYDSIVMWDVIEHLDKPIDTLNLLRKKLKESGLLFLSTPDVGSLFSRLTGRYWPFMTPPEHLSFFSTKSLEKIAQLTGFKIIHNKNMGKSVNFGFLFYKLKRIFPRIVPQFIVNFFKIKHLNKLYIYIPTHDIKYVVMKKTGGDHET